MDPVSGMYSRVFGVKLWLFIRCKQSLIATISTQQPNDEKHLRLHIIINKAVISSSTDLESYKGAIFMFLFIFLCLLIYIIF